jgi:hypothetical protein
MANKFAILDGNFTDDLIWSTQSLTVVPTTAPTLGDTAYANRRLVTINSNIQCDTLTNISSLNNSPLSLSSLPGTATGPISGMFLCDTFSNPITIRAGIATEERVSVPALCAVGTNDLEIIGTIRGSGAPGGGAGYVQQNNCSFLNKVTGTTNVRGLIQAGRLPIDPSQVESGIYAGARAMHHSTRGQLNVYGSLSCATYVAVNGSGRHGSYALVTTGPTNIYGDVIGNRDIGSPVVIHTLYIDTPTDNNIAVNIYGNVISGSSLWNYQNRACYINGGVVNIYGNIIGGATDSPVYIVSCENLSIYGNVIPSSAYSSIIIQGNPSYFASVNIYGNVASSLLEGVAVHTNGSLPGFHDISVHGNVINTANGIPAIYAKNWSVNSAWQNTIKYGNSGTGLGVDAYTYFFETTCLSAFTVPSEDKVRYGETYLQNTKMGLVKMPPASAVCIGVPFDNTSVGTSFIDFMEFYNTPVTILQAPGSIGNVVKWAARNSIVGETIEGFY